MSGPISVPRARARSPDARGEGRDDPDRRRSPARDRPARHPPARDLGERRLRRDRDVPGRHRAGLPGAGGQDGVGADVGLLRAADPRPARHPAAGLHRRRAALRRPVDRGEAGTAGRAVPARRDHRLDQGDRRALRGGGEGGRQRRGVRRPDHRDRRARRPGPAPGADLVPAPAQGAGARRGGQLAARHPSVRSTDRGSQEACRTVSPPPPAPTCSSTPTTPVDWREWG